MAEHTPTPWRVFTNDDGTKLVGIGSREGQGILDCGFGVWAWNDAEGIANAELVVKAVNNHDALVAHLRRLAVHCCDEAAIELVDALSPPAGECKAP